MKGMYLNLGANVRFRDGLGGTIHKVVFDPHTNQVTNLVIAPKGRHGHNYVIPVSVVEKALEEEIVVAIDQQDLTTYPQYRQVEIEERLGAWESEEFFPHEGILVWYPLAGIYERQGSFVATRHRIISQGIDMKEEVIGRTSIVHNLDGVVGNVDHVWLDPESWEITYLVVRSGLFPHNVVIPFSWMSSMTTEEIYVQGTDEQLKEISATQPPLELIHASGVVAGSDEFVPDNNLLIAEGVAAELAEDPRTASSVIEVIFERGVATLMGEVENEQVHTAAEEIAHHHAEVVTVVNALEVRPKSRNLDAMADMFGTLIGQAHIEGPVGIHAPFGY